MPTDAYARLLSLAKKDNLTTLLDSSGESLRHGVTTRADILKLNLSELAALSPVVAQGWQENSDSATIRENASMLADGLVGDMNTWVEQALIITLGKLGAIAITPEGRWYIPALSVPYVSPAGAGDGMTSGIMLALYQNGTWRDALALGTAMAASVVINPGTCECHPQQVEDLLPLVEIIDI